MRGDDAVFRPYWAANLDEILGAILCYRIMEQVARLSLKSEPPEKELMTLFTVLFFDCFR